jgi:hypothetical protein
VNMKYCATKHQNYIYSMAAICWDRACSKGMSCSR